MASSPSSKLSLLIVLFDAHPPRSRHFWRKKARAISHNRKNSIHPTMALESCDGKQEEPQRQCSYICKPAVVMNGSCERRRRRLVFCAASVGVFVLVAVTGSTCLHSNASSNAVNQVSSGIRFIHYSDSTLILSFLNRCSKLYCFEAMRK